MADINTLKQKLSLIFKNNNVPHAIIVEGRNEWDRKEFYLLIAKWAVCSSSNRPCIDCIHCKKVESGNHPDVKIIKPESNNKSIPIDTIREIRKDSFIIPNESDNKVYILENCDNLSIQSGNALLKILEEPPKNVIFILSCESSVSLLQTIKSRCQLYRIDSTADIIEENSKSILLSYDISKAILDSNEFELLSLSSVFIKNKELFFAVLKNLESVFHRAMLISYNPDLIDSKNDIEVILSNRLTKKALLSLINDIISFKKMLNQNANMTLLTTCFCQKLRKSAIL